MEPHALVRSQYQNRFQAKAQAQVQVQVEDQDDGINGVTRLTLTSDKWPVYILSGVTLSELHSLAVRSLLAVAKYTPIGPHSTSQTGSRPWPR
jgi:hypothetical protein